MKTSEKIVAVTACPTGIAHTIMAAEALKKTAEVMGYDIKVETQGSEGVRSPLSQEDIADADLVIIGADIHVDASRFAGKPVYATSTSRTIRSTKAVIEEAICASQQRFAIAESHLEDNESTVPTPDDSPVPVPPAAVSTAAKHLVGITACPTGIAHTFLLILF